MFCINQCYKADILCLKSIITLNVYKTENTLYIIIFIESHSKLKTSLLKPKQETRYFLTNISRAFF